MKKFPHAFKTVGNTEDPIGIRPSARGGIRSAVKDGRMSFLNTDKGDAEANCIITIQWFKSESER